MGDLAARFHSYRFEDMRVTRKWVNHISTNWKIWLENSREGYHGDVVHKETYRKYFPNRPKGEWRYAGSPGVYENLSGGNDDGLYLPRNPVFPLIEGLSAEDQATTHFAIFYPMLLLNIPPSHLAFHQLLPLGPGATTLVTWMCFPKSTVERPDFEREVGRYYDLVEMFLPEDQAVCESLQRGLQSRFAKAGRFAVEERPCYAFANYLLDRMTEPHPTRT
jgi:phenylpropionate dioxygenase-like ring-hydroxylating dioxygenase large terminal subunit